MLLLIDVQLAAAVININMYSTGPPESLVVTPDGEDITVENNSPLAVQVQVQDKAGNLTVQPRLNVVCKVTIACTVCCKYPLAISEAHRQ